MVEDPLADLAARLEGDDARALLDRGARQRALDLYAAVAGADEPTRTVLGRWFLRRYDLLGEPADLRAARACAALLRDSGSVPGDLADLLAAGPDLTARTTETARVLMDRYEETGDHRQLLIATELVDSLTATLPAGAELPVEVLGSTSRLAFGRFAAHADVADLDRAVTAQRRLLDRTGGAAEATDLARALLARSELRDAPADLAEARALLEPIAATRPDAATMLANVLRAGFEQTLDTAALDRAVELARTGAAQCPPGHPDRPNALEVLLLCLARRYTHLEDEQDLDAAIEVARELEAVSNPGGRGRAMALWGLATLLGMRALRSGSLTDLDAAIDLSRRAQRPAEDSALTRHSVLARHGGLLATRFLLSRQRTDLSAAIDLLRQALQVAPPAPLYLSTHRSGLAALLTLEAEITGSTAGLDEALVLGRAAVAGGPVGHPHRTDAMLTLAEVYATRYTLTRDAADARAAIGLRRVASAAPTGTVRDRMRAARYWLATALRLDDLAGAAEAAAAAVALLPLAAGRVVHRSGQERRLAGLTGLPGVAGALAIGQGRPERAVELIEQGRTVLWAQAAQVRGDLSRLAAAAPALADELDTARQRLYAAEGTDPAGYRAAADRFEKVLERARALPGFANFLGTTPFRDLRAAAGRGSVVVVNVAAGRSDALVVRADGVRVVPLPWLSLPGCASRAVALLGAVTEAERRPEAPLWTNLRQTLNALLRWLWDVAAAPVLAVLDELEPGPHRVWWCPTGPMTLLPLHAAGRYGSAQRWARQRRPTVPDRTVSSYTTGLAALLRARQRRPAAPDRTSMLAVGVPDLPDRPALPAVSAELDRVAAALPGTRRLTGTAATPSAVLAELDRHPWLHLACHATQQVDRPGDSAVHLHGGDLSALRLAGRQLPDADLAYLSACHTASGTMALADEAVHLAAALQLAGYRHVVGTLWAVSDRHAAAVAGGVYTALTAGGRPDATGTARALAAATAALRERHPDRPELWAPFVHFGP